MSKYLLLVSCSLGLLVACKADAPAPGPGSGAAEHTGAPPRSGKIDLGSGMARRAHTADDVPDPDPDRNHVPPHDRWDPSKREDMRKEREAKLDKDGDGKVSEAERNAARHERAVAMRARMDANGDGKVTPDELAKGGRMGRRLGDTTAIDTNHDGDISADELDAALAARVPRRDKGPKTGGSATPSGDSGDGMPNE